MRNPGLWYLFAAFFVVNCGSRAAPPIAPADDGAPNDGGPSDADTQQPFETIGSYRCCAPNTGTACCTDAPAGTCFEYGGTYKTCRNEGERYEAKSICARCCDGLEALDSIAPGRDVPPEADGLPDGCDFVGLDSVKICARCGDGVCGLGESFCNCPADCAGH